MPAPRIPTLRSKAGVKIERQEYLVRLNLLHEYHSKRFRFIGKDTLRLIHETQELKSSRTQGKAERRGIIDVGPSQKDFSYSVHL